MSQEIFVLVEHLRRQVMEITYVMLAAAREAAAAVQGEVVALLLGDVVQELARDLAADRVLSIDDPSLGEFRPDTYLSALYHLIQERQPRAALFGHTSIGMDVASGISARANLPLFSQCLQLRGSADGLGYVNRICGGKIVVEGALPVPTALLTMVPGAYRPELGRSAQAPPLQRLALPEMTASRIRLCGYIEPDPGDVDIRKAPVLVAVGRGLQNPADLELVQQLAQALGGEVCASRPIVDQRWLPTSRLVGKSGMSVRPKLYLALGISGAPEHVEGMTGSDLIIAVNSDPDAPIFEVAQYGVVGDMLGFAEALTQQLEQVKLA